MRPTLAPAEHAFGRDCAGQGEHRAAGGDEPEKDENEYLTQIVVAIGVFAADVAPAGHETGDTDQDEPPVAGQCNDSQTAQAGDQRVDSGRGKYFLWTHAGRDETAGPCWGCDAGSISGVEVDSADGVFANDRAESTARPSSAPRTPSE